MSAVASPNVQAAEQLLRSLPNPSHVREIWLDITWDGRQGSHIQAVLIVGLLVVAIIAIAVCFTVYAVKRGRR